MTTTVRILGSRAREQVPGTSITLLAPGFRGAMTQLGASAVADGGRCAAIQRAPRPARKSCSPRTCRCTSRRGRPKAVPGCARAARSPRIRASSCPGATASPTRCCRPTSRASRASCCPSRVIPTEAVFPLTICGWRCTRIARCACSCGPRSTCRARRVWPSASRWERLRRPNQLAQLGPTAAGSVPDWERSRRGPVLLLLHGTFGTPQARSSTGSCDESFLRGAASGTRAAAWRSRIPRSPPVSRRIVGWLRAHLLAIAATASTSWRMGAADCWRARSPPTADCRCGASARSARLTTARRSRATRTCRAFSTGTSRLLARARRHVGRTDARGRVVHGARSSRSESQPSTAGHRGHDTRQPVAARARRVSRPCAAVVHDRCAVLAGRRSLRQCRRSTMNSHAEPNDLVVPSDGCHDPGVQPRRLAATRRLGCSSSQLLREPARARTPRVLAALTCVL